MYTPSSGKRLTKRSSWSSFAVLTPVAVSVSVCEKLFSPSEQVYSMDSSPMSAAHTRPSASAISFMELRTRHAPVPHESSSSPTRPTTPARIGSGACEMGSSFWSRMGSCHGICIWFGLMIG